MVERRLSSSESVERVSDRRSPAGLYATRALDGTSGGVRPASAGLDAHAARSGPKAARREVVALIYSGHRAPRRSPPARRPEPVPARTGRANRGHRGPPPHVVRRQAARQASPWCDWADVVPGTKAPRAVEELADLRSRPARARRSAGACRHDSSNERARPLGRRLSVDGRGPGRDGRERRAAICRRRATAAASAERGCAARGRIGERPRATMLTDEQRQCRSSASAARTARAPRRG